MTRSTCATPGARSSHRVRTQYGERVDTLPPRLSQSGPERGELGTDGVEGISIEGDRDISVIDVSDTEVVMVGGEEGSRRKQEKRKRKKGWWW